MAMAAWPLWALFGHLAPHMHAWLRSWVVRHHAARAAHATAAGVFPAMPMYAEHIYTPDAGVMWPPMGPSSFGPVHGQYPMHMPYMVSAGIFDQTHAQNQQAANGWPFWRA